METVAEMANFIKLWDWVQEVHLTDELDCRMDALLVVQ
jgi:hypothetical protein